MIHFESFDKFGEFFRAILLSFSLSITIFFISLSMFLSQRKKISFKQGFLILLFLVGFVIFLLLNFISLNEHVGQYWISNATDKTRGDLANWATVVIEIGIGSFISGMVFLYDREQNKKNEEKQKKKREYALQKIKLLLALVNEEFQAGDYEFAKETFDKIVSTLNILSDAFDAQELQQILELSEIGNIFCKYKGEYPIHPSRTMPFTTSVPANKAALLAKFNEVIRNISEKYA